MDVMATQLATVAPKTYGGLKPTGSLNADGFASHEATKAWNDQGAGETMLMTLAPEIRAYGAEQAKLAVLDYLTNAFADLCVVEGNVCTMVDASNEEAPFATFWDSVELEINAIQQAVEAQDEAFITAMERKHARVGEALDAARARFRPQPTVRSQQARPIRAGATRPSGAVRPPPGRRAPE